MGKTLARAIALAAVATPGSALAHHGGPEDIGIGAVAVAVAVGLVALLAAILRPSIRR